MGQINIKDVDSNPLSQLKGVFVNQHQAIAYK